MGVGMGYKSKPGETEFGGVGGMYPDENVLAPSLQQETWAMYATNEGGAVSPDGEDEGSLEFGRKHIGDARHSFSVNGTEPNLTIAPWPPVSEEDEDA